MCDRCGQDVDHLANIRKVFEKADAVDLREGKLSYCRYNAMMTRIGEHYGYSMETVAAVFAALSPNNDYIKNLRSTVTLLHGFRQGKPIDQLTVSTYRHCARRAWRILEGEDFLTFTRGMKTRSFFVNIIDPFDRAHITIDGHMLSVWKGQKMTMKAHASGTFHYATVAGDYIKTAEMVGLIPNQLQSVIWFTWKRINNIIFKPQMSLFRQHDQWRLDLDPLDIKPF